MAALQAGRSAVRASGRLASPAKFRGRYIDEEPKDFSAFVSCSRFGNFTDKRLHLSLLPTPYGGDLRTADIFVLLLNPGFAFSDYHAETRVLQYRRRLEQMLAQDFKDTEFPFLWLDPEYCWSGGFCWWEEKLREVITIIAKEKFKDSYLNALRDVSKRLAHLELVPYHSSSFDAHRLIEDLPSVHAVRRFAQESLVSAAIEGKKTVIITRQVAAWGIPRDTRNFILYEGGHTRGASLGRNSRGGRAFLDQYGISVSGYFA